MICNYAHLPFYCATCFIVHIADKQKGLISAFYIVGPTSTHMFYVNQLHANLKVVGFIGKPIKDVLCLGAKPTTINSFTEAMRHIKKLDVEAFAWLADKHPSEWSRSHFSTTPI